MELLALIGIGLLVRRLRRRARPQPRAAAAPVVNQAPAREIATPLHPAFRLLTRAARGLLLAGLLITLALLPFPHDLSMSASLAPTAETIRWWIIAHFDALTVSAVGYALLEPLLACLVRALCLVPRLLTLLVGLGWVRLRIGYWRCRNWRARCRRRVPEPRAVS